MPPDNVCRNIVAALGALDDFPEFAPRSACSTPAATSPLVAELTDLFARVYLANARNIPTVIAFIHGVTSHAALGNIAPYDSDASARSALRYAWQTGCALYACYGSGTAKPTLGPSENRGGADHRAVANGDEHVIKFTEACLSRYAHDPSPAYSPPPTT